MTLYDTENFMPTKTKRNGKAGRGFAPRSVMPRPEDFPQRKPGEPVRLNWKNQVLRFACCDCALVHNIKFAVKGERLTLRAYRNKRLTAHFRKTTRKDAWGVL